MFCFLVELRVRHPWITGPDVLLRRRVFGQSSDAATRLCVLLLLTGGWFGQVRVRSLVSAAADSDVPFLDTGRDLLPPPRPSKLDSRAGSPGGATLPTSWESHGTSFVAPVRPQRVRDIPQGLSPAALRELQDVGKARQRGLWRERQRRARARRGPSDVPPCPSLSAPCCGWGLDRRCASARPSLDVPHHDAHSANAGWPDVLMFGPDVASWDDEEELC